MKGDYRYACVMRCHRLAHGHDGDALVTAHAEQVAVATDDQFSLAGDGRGNDVIVVGIVGHHARGGQRRDNDGQFAIQVDGQLNRGSLLRQAQGQVLVSDDVARLGQQCGGRIQLPCLRKACGASSVVPVGCPSGLIAACVVPAKTAVSPWKTLTEKHPFAQNTGNANVLISGFSLGPQGKVPCFSLICAWHGLCNIQSSISGDKECTVAISSPSRRSPPWALPR